MTGKNTDEFLLPSDTSQDESSKISVGSNAEPIRRNHLVCDDLALEGVKAAIQMSCSIDNEYRYIVFQSLMDEISTLSVNIVCHVPRNVRPLLAQVLSVEFNHACQEGLWGFARLFLFAKAVLRSPPRGGKKKDML